MKQICKIKGYENINPNYYVTKEGEFISYCDRHGGRKETPTKLKQKIKTHGYLYVTLCDIYGKAHSYRSHIIVAKAYVPNPNNLPQVDHGDSNKLNNNYKNLSWMTPSQNSAKSNGKKVIIYRYGKFIGEYNSCKEASKEIGIDPQWIARFARGVRNKPRDGYTVKLKE